MENSKTCVGNTYTGRTLGSDGVEEFICYHLELLEEDLFLVGYEKEVILCNKSKIDRLFKIINSRTILYAEYINGNEQEIRILLTNGKTVFLETV